MTDENGNPIKPAVQRKIAEIQALLDKGAKELAPMAKGEETLIAYESLTFTLWLCKRAQGEIEKIAEAIKGE